MGDQTTFGIAITASDKTDKGAKSAEKRVGRVGKAAGTISSKAIRDSERTIARSSGGMVRSLAAVGRASAGALSGGSGASGASGITSRLAAATEGALRFSTRMWESASAVETASSSITSLLSNIPGIGTLASVAGAAVSAITGLATGTAQIGRTAQTIGVGTRALQEFQAAGERVGVDRNASAGALGNIAQTINDARYGRNNEALALMTRLGVGFRTGADGQLDPGATALDLARAIARQRNAQTRRMIAQHFGISDSVLPMFAQGADQLQADMTDADSHASVVSDQAIGHAQHVQRNLVRVGQLAQHAIAAGIDASAETIDNAAQAAADGLASGSDSVFGTTGQGSNRGGATASSAGATARAVGGATPRVGTGASGLQNGTLNLSAADVDDLKRAVETEWDHRSPQQLAGIVDTILNRQASGHWGRTVADVVNARSQFSDINGPVAWRRGRHSVAEIPMSQVRHLTSEMVEAWLAQRAAGEASSVGSNLNYANPNGSSRRNLGWISRLNGPTFGSGQSIHRHGTTPENEPFRPEPYGVALPATATPVEVRVEIHDRRVHATVRAPGGGRPPAVSYALLPNAPSGD